MTALQIADEIAAKMPPRYRYPHLQSVRFWLAYADEHPAPDGEKYRIIDNMLYCWSDYASDRGGEWFPARGFHTPDYVRLYGARLPV